jgi:glutamyl/glutaminyl-tRNA synthetase
VVRLPLERLRQWLPEVVPPGVDEATAQAFYEVVRPNVELPQDAAHWARVVFGEVALAAPDTAAEAAIRAAGGEFFAQAMAAFEQSGSDLKALTRAVSQVTGRKGPGLFMPLRAALTGETHGPELGPLLRLMPAQIVKKRLGAAADYAAGGRAAG